jgi:hypothetical protein
LLFLAPDRRRLGELEQAMRYALAWQWIVDSQETLDLTPFHRRQAESKAKEWDQTVEARVLETWIWAFAPRQDDPQRPEIQWQIDRVGGQEPLAARAAKRFVRDEALFEQLGPRRLRDMIDKFGLWRDQGHVEVKQVLTDFATYLYLPRLRDRQPLLDAVRAAIGQLVCEYFAYADGYGDAGHRYIGLTATGGGNVLIDPTGLLVKPEVAAAQLEMPVPPPPRPGADDEVTGRGPETPVTPVLPTRFCGSVSVDPDRAGRDVGRIAEEVLQHLTTLRGTKVRLTLEVQAEVPDGAPDDVQRVISENCQTLRFTSHGFERT